MTEIDFDNRIKMLFPGQKFHDGAFQSWHQYANELDADGTEKKTIFYRDLSIEIGLVAEHNGSDIALQLFNLGSAFTLNPYEIRGAADLLQEGTVLPEIAVRARDDDLYRSPAQEEQFEAAKKIYFRELFSNKEGPEMEQTPKIQTLNGDIAVGHWVVVTHADSRIYGGLIGQVTSIYRNKMSEQDRQEDSAQSAKHSCERIHIDFFAANYPPWSHNDMLEAFQAEFQDVEFSSFEELPLGDVIIESKHLISLNDLDAAQVRDLINSYEDSVAYCEKVLHSLTEKAVAPITVKNTDRAALLEMIATTNHSGFLIGDWVLSKPNDAYGGLVGQVTDIFRVGSPDHETGNETDDIHVDFSLAVFPHYRVKEFEQDFSKLYGEPRGYDDLPLDDVIMSPHMLIRFPEGEFNGLDTFFNSYGTAAVYAETVPDEQSGNLEERLVERVRENHADFLRSLQSFGKHEIVDMAHKIAAMSDACEYMTAAHGFEPDELHFYLQFQNPLEIVADAWLERNADISDLSFTMDNVFEHRKEHHSQYPLLNRAPSELSTPPLDNGKGTAAAPSKKLSIAEHLRVGKEKVDAYKAKNIGVPPVKKNKKNDKEK